VASSVTFKKMQLASESCPMGEKSPKLVTLVASAVEAAAKSHHNKSTVWHLNVKQHFDE
jgi:hypothetical protein